jgi:hypothetical protein
VLNDGGGHAQFRRNDCSIQAVEVRNLARNTQAYAESHESDPPEISEGFKELECFLESLPLSDNNAVFNLCCRLCTAYEAKAFRHGLLYGAHLMQELFQSDCS